MASLNQEHSNAVNIVFVMKLKWTTLEKLLLVRKVDMCTPFRISDHPRDSKVAGIPAESLSWTQLVVEVDSKIASRSSPNQSR